MKRFYILSLLILSIILAGYVPCDANQVRRDPLLLLQYAIDREDIEDVKKYLLEVTDINAKNIRGDAPLHMAVNKQNKEIIMLILEKSPEIDAKDVSGRTSLHIATNSGQKEIVEILLEKGANVNEVDSRSETPLSMARRRGYTEIIDILISHGATDTNNENNTSGNERDNVQRENYLTEENAGNNARGTEERVNLLADPNEIKARVKTFEGLEKAIEEVDSESKLGMRRWQSTRNDNRLTIVRNVQKQLENEINLIKKIALEEDANNTVLRADTLVKLRDSRTMAVVRELREQSREEEQQNRTDNSGTRGRGSTRGNRGTSTRGGRGSTRSGANDSDENNEQQEPVDEEEQAEINLWLQADIQDYDGKVALFTAMNEKIQIDFNTIRQSSEAENAKKTTAAIDGLLLARKIRYDELNQYLQEAKRKAQEREARNTRDEDDQEDNTTGRGGGRRSSRR